MDRYLGRNCELLADSYATLASLCDGTHPSLLLPGRLSKDVNIPMYPARAGFFAWLDLRSFLPFRRQSFEPSNNSNKRSDRWKMEADFMEVLFDECKIVCTPGRMAHAREPGFFRVCFSSVSVLTLIEAMTRLRGLLGEREL